ncbi:MAG: DNA repair protein RecO [Deinococcaceae bacterium]
MKGSLLTVRGIVIRRTVLPNQDVFAHLLTPQKKLKVIVRATHKNPLRMGLNLFHDVDIQLKTGSDGLHTLTQVHLEGALAKLSQPGRYEYAHLVAELVDRLVPEGPAADRWLRDLASTLRGLSEYNDPDWLSLVMVFRFLTLGGFAPKVTWEGSTPPRYFDPLLGSVSTTRGLPIKPEVVLFLRQMYQIPVRQLLDTGLEAKDRKKMWLLLGSHIEHHIGVLKSFKALSQMHYCETVTCGTKVS